VLRQADTIFLEELRSAGLERQVAQAFAVLLPIQSVGVMGDGRTYENVVALRAVETDDFMTADWSRFAPRPPRPGFHSDHQLRQGINRVVYDVTSKPPAPSSGVRVPHLPVGYASGVPLSSRGYASACHLSSRGYASGVPLATPLFFEPLKLHRFSMTQPGKTGTIR